MLESYRRNVNFIAKYKKATNASSGSEVDSNANVENKNITTCMGELPKREIIGTNRLLMYDKIKEMYDEDLANEYIRQLDSHEIYKHDETSIMPYCVSITMYPFLFEGLKSLGGISTAPTNLQAFCGSFINLVFAIASQFAGAVSTPEFLTYLDYCIRKEYGDDYYENTEKIVSLSKKEKNIDKVITDCCEQIVYSMNQPAAARNFQSVFWNIAYFDEPYFNGIFDDFIFPDGTEPKWVSVSWLQKRFMKWFNKERLKTFLTFPVETMNLLNDGKEYVDKEWYDFVCEMYGEGHSFFTYTSDSVDSLASCCFDGKQMCLTKSSNGVNYMSFKELYESSYKDSKRNFTIFHNGSWVNGKIIKLPKRDMYKITTSNNKELYVTDNHIFPTFNGDKKVSDLTEEDYILFNNRKLDTFPEKDKGLTYEEGYLIGMYLGDGSVYQKENITPTISLSLNENKYINSKSIIEKALNKLDNNCNFVLNKSYNNVYPTTIRSWIINNFIKEYVSGKYCFEKELSMNCLLQSYEFRRGILDGYYETDGGNSNRIYTTSYKLVGQIELLCTSLGINTIVNVSDRTGDGLVVIRGKEFNRNYPVYCIRWYETYKRNQANIYKRKNNSIYFKIKSIEKCDYEDEYVYCFEMKNEEEPYFTLPNGIITHNCRLKSGIEKNVFSYTLGAGGLRTGSKKVITLNLNRITQDWDRARRKEPIEEYIGVIVKRVHKYLIAWNEWLKDLYKAGLLTVYSAGYIALEDQYLTVGVNGGLEAAEYLGIETRADNPEYQNFMNAVLTKIKNINLEDRTPETKFNTEFVPAENASVKLYNWDKRDGYWVPACRNLYNSYFFPVEDPTYNVLEKIRAHGSAFISNLDGGSAAHIGLDAHLSKQQYRLMMNYCA